MNSTPPSFVAAHAADKDWKRAAETCIDDLGSLPAGANLGFVYASDQFAGELGDILAHLRRTTGVEDWVGSLGIGIVSGADGYFDEAALAVMVAAFPDGAFRVMATLDADIDQLAADDRAWIDATEPTFAIVHGDPTNARTPALVDDLAGTGAGFLVGGLTSSRGSHHQIAGGVTDGGVSGVLFAPTVDVATSLSQGCTPMAGAHEITGCEENVLMSLDGRPALDVFKEDIGELLAHDLQRVAGYVHAALPIAGTDTGDYTVRNLMAIDPDRGWLAIGAEVQAGDRVLFVRRDPSSAIEDMQAMLDRLKRRLDGPPAGGVYFSCLARGPNMFGSADHEMGMIRDTLGDFPVVGFFGEGEISNCRLYGYTGVLAVFV